MLRPSALIAFFLACAGILAVPGIAYAQPAVPPIPVEGWVFDQADVLSVDDEFNINTQIQNVRDTTGAQFAVLTTNDCGPDIDGYRNQVFNTWGIGQAGKDNGLLLLVCMATRDVKVETGYGLEWIIPDILAKEGIDDHFVPKAGNGDMVGGVLDMFQYYAGLIIGATPQPAAANSTPGIITLVSDTGSKDGLPPWKIFLLIVLAVLIAGAVLWFALGGDSDEDDESDPDAGDFHGSGGPSDDDSGDDDDSDNGGDDEDDGFEPDDDAPRYRPPAPSYRPSPTPSYRPSSRPSYTPPSRPFGGGFGGGRSGGGGAGGRF